MIKKEFKYKIAREQEIGKLVEKYKSVSKKLDDIIEEPLDLLIAIFDAGYEKCFDDSGSCIIFIERKNNDKKRT